MPKNDKFHDEGDYFIRDIESVEAYVFDENGKEQNNGGKGYHKKDAELYESNIRTLRLKACTLWFHPTAAEKDHLLLSERRCFESKRLSWRFGSPSAPPRCVFSRHIFPRSTQWDRTVCFRNKVRMEKRSWNAHGPINISMSPRL